MIPADPGTYLLHLRLPQPRILRIGRLGEFSSAPAARAGCEPGWAGTCEAVGSPTGTLIRCGRQPR
jgi:hypothetical protein